MVDQLNPRYEYWASSSPCQKRKQVSGGDHGPGPEPIPLSSKLWLSSSSQGRRGRGIHDSHVGRFCNDWTQWAYILKRKLQPDSNVLRIHTHERKPRLQDGTVTVDTDKYRLVGIPPSEPPDVGLTRIR